MTRLVLRVCIGVVLTLVTFVICADLWLWTDDDRRTGEAGEDVLLEVLDGTARTATRRLEHAANRRDRKLALAGLEETFGFPFRLEDRAALAVRFPDRVGTVDDPGLPFFLPPDESDELVLVVPEAPPGDDAEILLIGPIPDPMLASEQVDDDSSLLVDLAVFLAITFVAAWLILRPTARKVRKLEAAAERLGRGEWDARAGIEGSDLIGQLGRRFDEMAQRIGTLVENQRYLLHSISHEIRTPLARTQFRLEGLRSAATDEKRAAHLAGLESDLNGLEQLIEELLSFVRLTEGEMNVETASFDAAAVVGELLAGDLAASRAEAPDPVPAVTVEVDGMPWRAPPHVRETDDKPTRTRAPDAEERAHWVEANEALFRRALGNLLANARRAARTRVVVRLGAGEDGRCRVEVADDGPGVAPEDREAIFKPFARADRSRTRSSGGVGLGLALVARIAELHGGVVFVERDAQLGGARFVTSWARGASSSEAPT